MDRIQKIVGAAHDEPLAVINGHIFKPVVRHDGALVVAGLPFFFLTLLDLLHNFVSKLVDY